MNTRIAQNSNGVGVVSGTYVDGVDVAFMKRAREAVWEETIGKQR